MRDYYVTELSQKAKYYNIPLPKVSRIDKYMETESILCLQGLGMG